MSRRTPIPSYRLHKQSGQAIVTLTDPSGERKDVLLGTYDSPESRVEYTRVIAEWEANGRCQVKAVNAQSDLTIAELITRYWPHVEQHYRRPDGTPTREVEDYKFSLRPLNHLYGHTVAKDFGPLALKAVRQLMLSGYQHPKYGEQSALARGVINQRIGRIRRMFRWAVAEELIEESIHRALMTVSGLQRGRSKARETEPVKPVAEAVVAATLPYLQPQPRAMVQLQQLTGMRPGEVVVMRGIDLDTTGKVWLYRPGSDQGPAGQHKTAHRGHDKVIALGPKAQDIIKPWLRLNLTEYLFQPREAMAAYREQQRKNRKSKVQPSQQHRKKKKPKKAPGDNYTSRSYAQAIAKGVKGANKAMTCPSCKAKEPEQRCAACQAKAIPHWHPHQLRHNKATQIRREAGMDAARAALGHRSPKVTEIYAEIDMQKVIDLAERFG